MLAGCGVVAAELAGAEAGGAEAGGAEAGGAEARDAEAGGAEAAELAGAAAGAGAADVAAGEAEPVPEPVLAVPGCELVEGGGALALETAPLTADVAWETACPTADDPVPESPCDAPDVACVPAETADPSADDRPPADDEPPEPVDAADAEPGVRTESPMARPMAATARPAAYSDSRRTLVTTSLATGGNLARHLHDVHVRERPQFGQMSTRLPLIPRSLPGSAHRHFTYFRMRTDVPGPDGRSAPGPPSRRRSAVARAGQSVTRTSTFGLASHPVRAWSPFTVQTIVLIPRRRHSARTPVRASRWCITATSARLATTRSSRESPRARSRRTVNAVVSATSPPMVSPTGTAGNRRLSTAATSSSPVVTMTPADALRSPGPTGPPRSRGHHPPATAQIARPGTTAARLGPFVPAWVRRGA